MRLMRNIRTSIKEGRFPEFVKDFLQTLYPERNYPDWACEALAAVNIDVKS